MEAIKIGGDAGREDVKDILDKYFLNAKLNIEEKDYENRFEFIFFPGRKKSFYDISLYSQLGKLVNDIIMKIYIKKIIRERTDKICRDYSSKEKQEIMKESHCILLNENYFAVEKNRILEEIIDYIMENNSIIIDGFVNFRMNRFLYIIDISIEKAISNFEIEREYQEFISMLQYFVDIQEPKADEVNLIFNDDDYLLLDKEHNRIEEVTLEDINDELFGEGISKSDLLVSSLIVLSPLKLVIHGKQEGEVIDVVSKIFKDKIEFCDGCDICQEKSKYMLTNKKEVD